ncbi:MAG: hypothetical protein ABIH74_04495, partial [Candidatus Omnitrophota bacterium]
IIRVLHDKSFIDDPTRIFRAVRFEQRFGFMIEKHTEYLIMHAVKQEMFRRTENQRIRDELVLLLKEKDPVKTVLRMQQLHEMRFIHPELVLGNSTKSTFKRLKKHLEWYNRSVADKNPLNGWLMNLMIMLEKLTERQTDEVLEKFVFTRKEKETLRAYKKRGVRVSRKLSLSRKMRPSEVFCFLKDLSHEEMLCIMSRTTSAAIERRVRKFFTEYNGTKLQVKGHDIQAEGITPGPGYGEVLWQVLREKLDGKLPKKKDEIRYLKKILNRESPQKMKRKKHG